jgi:acylphosphatase
MERRAHILVSGNVQGVFFRSFTKRFAKQLGLKGWVRNLADGRVEIKVEGENSDIQKLIKHVRNGPKSSEVTRVDIQWEECSGEYEDFRIVG